MNPNQSKLIVSKKNLKISCLEAQQSMKVNKTLANVRGSDTFFFSEPRTLASVHIEFIEYINTFI